MVRVTLTFNGICCCQYCQLGHYLIVTLSFWKQDEAHYLRTEKNELMVRSLLAQKQYLTFEGKQTLQNGPEVGCKSTGSFSQKPFDYLHYRKILASITKNYILRQVIKEIAGAYGRDTGTWIGQTKAIDGLVQRVFQALVSCWHDLNKQRFLLMQAPFLYHVRA
ncbi:hypothetical protein M758_4G263600 [Ceratodon purpureus]|nr:hypothetical protein M758_4G263600 [Ceratodon purpureus]